MSIRSNVEAVQEKIAHAAQMAGRKPEDVTLIAVTKTVDSEAARQVMQAGVLELGENRVQSFLDKYEVLKNEPNWHIIGHLQTNKVKYIVGKVKLIHSVDSVHLAEEISKKAQSLGVCQDVLFQFNISGEASKSGAAKEEAQSIFEELAKLPGISVKGLMTMAPLMAEEYEIRKTFSGLRELSEKIGGMGYPNATMEHLSMGMSGDFEAAIQEGANLVRIGSALFK